jgi:hypothetical protein
MASDDDMTGVTSKPTQPLFSDDDGGNFTHNLCSRKGNALSHGFFNSSGNFVWNIFQKLLACIYRNFSTNLCILAACSGLLFFTTFAPFIAFSAVNLPRLFSHMHLYF